METENRRREEIGRGKGRQFHQVSRRTFLVARTLCGALARHGPPSLELDVCKWWTRQEQAAWQQEVLPTCPFTEAEVYLLKVGHFLWPSLTPTLAIRLFSPDDFIFLTQNIKLGIRWGMSVPSISSASWLCEETSQEEDRGLQLVT